MNINFEEEIEKILNEDLIIPDSVLEKKEVAVNIIRKKRFKFLYKRKIVSFLLLAAIIGGMAFGNTAIAAIKNTLFPNNAGVQSAVDNGYIQNLQNKTMINNGVEIKVNNVLKDSKRVAISLNLKFDDKSLMKNFKYAKIRVSLKTKDGKEIPTSQNYNFSVNKSTGEFVFNDILSIMDGFGDKDMILAAKEYKNINALNLAITRIELYSDASAKMDPNTLPKLDDDSKKQLAEANVKLYKVIDGTWKTNIKLNDKFKDARPIEYKSFENNDLINIISAEMLPTGMDITFCFNNQTKPLSEEVSNQIDKISLVDDKGNTYRASDGGVETTNNKNTDITNITKTFYVTSFDKTGNLKMIIKDLNGNAHEIKLIKASGTK